MSLQALLSARAYQEGRAVRSALVRHRSIESDPVFLVAWQNGFDPFACAAIAFGQAHAEPELFVMSGTQDRELEAREYAAVAERFCELFESYGAASTPIDYQGHKLEVPVWPAQLVIANNATLRLLGRIGRRLAGAPRPSGGHPPDEATQRLLRRFACHLLWLARYADLPGQQIALSCTDFLNAHWATALSTLECESLFALEAWIAPPGRMGGFDAAVAAERFSAGPQLKPEDAQTAARLYAALESARRGGGEGPAVEEALEALRELYRGLTTPVWKLLLEIVRRERAVPGAAHLARRIERDRVAYALHLERLERAVADPRGIRFTENAREAALRRDELERAAALLEVEEALDDALKMLPRVLSGEAIEGEVAACTVSRTDGATVVLRTEEPCTLPPGLELWWSGAPTGRGWSIERIEPGARVEAAGTGSKVTLAQPIRKDPAGCPTPGDRALFSPLHFDDHLSYGLSLPARAPWTHRPGA
jgi:hypothetical protein